MIERRTRDLVMFNLAIDSKLRGCDVVALKVEDIAPGGYGSLKCNAFNTHSPSCIYRHIVGPPLYFYRKIQKHNHANIVRERCLF